MSEGVVETIIVAKDDTKRATTSAAKNFRTLGQKIDATNKKVSNGMRATTRQARAQMAQLGYQFQDIAVQIQGGQNALMVLGQQGSQIASVFGAGGAVVGAVVATAAAVTSALLPALFKANENLEELAENAETLFSNLESGGVGTANLDLLEDALLLQIDQQVRQIEEAEKALREAQDALRVGPFPAQGPAEFAMRAVLPVLPEGVKEKLGEIFPDEAKYREMEDGVLADELALSKLNLTLRELRERLSKVREQQDIAASEGGFMTDKELRAQQKLVSSLQRDATNEWLADAARRGRAYKKILTDIEQEEAMALRHEASLKRQARAFELANNPAAKFYDQLKKLEELQPHISAEAYENALFDIHAGFELLEGDLEIPKKVKSEWEKAAESMKNSISDAVTDSIVNFRSLGDVVTSVGRMIASTYIKKTIADPFAASLTSFLPSFDGGGFTGGSSRSGGMDGKGGFPAILHPNETVIDHTKGQSAGGNVVNVTYSPQVNALDPRTAAMVIAENAPTVVGIIEQSLNRRGRSAFA